MINLKNESLVVNDNDVLAFEPSLQHQITMMKRIAGLVTEGLFNVRFEGSDLLALTSHFEPIVLRVLPSKPVFTDPNATIAWICNLNTDLRVDATFHSLLGRGSGESVQMVFEGDGFVVIQPYEEIYIQHQGGAP